MFMCPQLIWKWPNCLTLGHQNGAQGLKVIKRFKLPDASLQLLKMANDMCPNPCSLERGCDLACC
jgi:hypothetical protein